MSSALNLAEWPPKKLTDYCNIEFSFIPVCPCWLGHVRLHLPAIYTNPLSIAIGTVKTGRGEIRRLIRRGGFIFKTYKVLQFDMHL